MTEQTEPKIKFTADKIKHKETPDDYIADIPVQLVFEWVKNGKWKYKDFQRWLKVLRVVE